MQFIDYAIVFNYIIFVQTERKTDGFLSITLTEVDISKYHATLMWRQVRATPERELCNGEGQLNLDSWLVSCTAHRGWWRIEKRSKRRDMCRWICYFSLMIRDREAECELDEPTVDIMRWVIERERERQ